MGESNGYGTKPKARPQPDGAPSIEVRMRAENARQLMVKWMKERHGTDDPTIPDVLAALILQLEHVTTKVHDMEKRAGDAPRIIMPGS